MKKNKLLYKLTVILLVILSFNAKAQEEINYFCKAQVELEYNNLDSALIAINNSIGTANQDYSKYIFRGNIYYNQHKYDLAINDYKKSNNLKTNSADFELSRLYTTLNIFDTACLYIETHLKSKYRKASPIILNDSIFSKLEEYKKWKEIWKNDWYNKTEQDFQEIEFHIKNENNLRALELLDKLLSKKKRAKAYYYRSLVFYNLTDYKNSLSDIDAAIRQQSKNADYFTHKGEILLKLKKYKKAQSTFLYIERYFPEEVKNYKSLAKIFLLNGKSIEASIRIKKYLKYYYKDAEAYGINGEIEYLNEEFFKAIISYNKALELDPRNYKYWNGRGDSFLITRAFNLAIKDYSNALDINPQWGKTFYNRGLAYYNIGSKTKACSDWKNAMKYQYTDAYNQLYLHCQEKP